MNAAPQPRARASWRAPLVPVLTLAGIVLIWQAVVSAGVAPPTFLPAPASVAATAGRLLGSGVFWADLEASLFRVLAAFLLSASLALPMALGAVASSTFARATEPLVGFFRYTPVAAFIPLCILWIGIGDGEKIAVIFLGTFFQLTVMLTDAVRRVPEHYYGVARTLGASRRQTLWDVTFPAALPAIYDALRVAMGWAWSYVVLAELVAASEGVGYRLLQAQRYLRTDEVFAGILLIGLVGLLIDLGMAYIRPLFLPWAEQS